MELFSAEFFSRSPPSSSSTWYWPATTDRDRACGAWPARAFAQSAIVWGTAGAIIVRTAMTLVGGVAAQNPRFDRRRRRAARLDRLQLVIENDSDDAHNSGVPPRSGRNETIVIADALMDSTTCSQSRRSASSFVLVVAGLLISIPIVIWEAS